MRKGDDKSKEMRKLAILIEKMRKERELEGYWEKEGDIVDY